MKKGIRAHDIQAEGLENISLLANKYNIKYLQLVLEKSVSEFKTGDFSYEYAKTIKKKLGDLEIAILGSYINPSNPDKILLKSDIEKMKEYNLDIPLICEEINEKDAEIVFENFKKYKQKT